MSFRSHPATLCAARHTRVRPGASAAHANAALRPPDDTPTLSVRQAECGRASVPFPLLQ
jgi:hypothetical protein